MIDNLVLMRTIYGIFQEYRKSEDKEYRKFLDTHINCTILHEAKESDRENYLTYWESLKKNGDNLYCKR